MHFLKLIALSGLFAGAALAAPNAEPNTPPKPPPKPSPPPTNPDQTNACGNGAAPFCCTGDGYGGYVSCYSFQFSSQCSATTVCCNANNVSVHGRSSLSHAPPNGG
ncbi:MAG: hypothetical protein Q9207_001894 [Kuettlingeria erythrocarpa]